ncbi:MAG: EH signature domain-containing protein [Nodularia sp. CChRGM 3473]
MILNFRTLSLEQPQSRLPAKLLDLVNNFKNPQYCPQLYNLPKIEVDAWRSLNEIIHAIQLGNTDQLKRLEWVYCLYNKAQWDLEHPQMSMKISELIWQAALNNLWLQQTLLWLLVLDYSESQQIISKSLVETFSVFVSHAREKDIQPAIQIIQAIAKTNYHQLALLAGESNLTPQELLNNANLPHTIPAVHQALNRVVEIFVRNKQPEWLLRCFQQMSQKQQHRQVEKLLTSMTAETGSRFFLIVEWLRQNYGPRTNHSRWHELSQKAQSALRQWIGAATWGDFENLITVLVNNLEPRLQRTVPNTTEYINLDRQIKQLKSRKDFWSNYSDRFERLRILVLTKSNDWISQELTRGIDIHVDDKSTPKEICIFDFGDLFIVEFFRGLGSETLFFNRHHSPYYEQDLFQSQKLSIEDIRRLFRFGGKIHDHVYLWQYHAERWLRIRNGIYPNDGIRYFRGLPKFCNQYNRLTGLPVPSLEDQRVREENLPSWQRRVELSYQQLDLNINWDEQIYP